MKENYKLILALETGVASLAQSIGLDGAKGTGGDGLNRVGVQVVADPAVTYLHHNWLSIANCDGGGLRSECLQARPGLSEADAKGSERPDMVLRAENLEPLRKPRLR